LDQSSEFFFYSLTAQFFNYVNATTKDHEVNYES